MPANTTTWTDPSVDPTLDHLYRVTLTHSVENAATATALVAISTVLDLGGEVSLSAAAPTTRPGQSTKITFTDTVTTQRPGVGVPNGTV